jgi:hypothetical protein
LDWPGGIDPVINGDDKIGSTQRETMHCLIREAISFIAVRR